MQPPVKLAILDMYDRTPNQGMRCIREIAGKFDHSLNWRVYDVRGKAEVPGLNYDIYIASGGPGSPHEGDGVWDARFNEWIDKVWNWNLRKGVPKKHVFFICHSYQMACKHFKVGKVTRRKSQAFGIFPVHKTPAGHSEPLFDDLPNPFYTADFRNWQVVQPDKDRLDALGAKILALEKIRPHVPYERAVMAIRFSNEFFGTQFHPEADADGMLDHFLSPERRRQIVKNHSEQKYFRMIDHLRDQDKISLTQRIILPLFLDRAIHATRVRAAAV